MTMPEMKDIKKTVKDANSLRICGSLDAGIKLKRKNDLHAVKSFAVHKSCNIPLLRAVLVMLGIMASMCLLMMIKKKMKGN